MHYVAWTTLGRNLILSGTPEEVIGPLGKAVAIQPHFPAGWHNLLSALTACERWDEANQMSREALTANPDNPGLLEFSAWLQKRHPGSAGEQRE